MIQLHGHWLPDGDTYFAPILARGTWEPEKLDAALAHVIDWRVAVDGGAHVGLYTCALAKRFAAVHAVEPAADSFECLCRNLELHPNVRLHRLALGDGPGRARIGDDPARPGNTGSRFIVRQASSLSAKDRLVDAMRRPCPTCPVVTLDSFRLPALGFLKLDVEGAEILALRGARRTLLQFRPVVMIEVKNGFAERFGEPTEAAPDLLMALGAREVARLRADRIYVFDDRSEPRA